MKSVVTLVATSVLLAFSVQAEVLTDNKQTNLFGISFKSSNFGDDLSKAFPGDALKDLDEEFTSLGLHWGTVSQRNANQTTSRYVFLDYGKTEVPVNALLGTAKIDRQLAIIGVGRNLQHNLNDLFYLKGGAELGLYNDKLTVQSRSVFGSSAQGDVKNTGALLAGYAAAGLMVSPKWDLELGVKYQYFAGNDKVFDSATQVFFGVNYNY